MTAGLEHHVSDNAMKGCRKPGVSETCFVRPLAQMLPLPPAVVETVVLRMLLLVVAHLLLNLGIQCFVSPSFSLTFSLCMHRIPCPKRIACTDLVKA